MENKWIKVEDILPENCQEVIIVGGGDPIIGFYVTRDEKWRCIDIDFIVKDIDFSVTHWMPLPEPPID